MLAPPKKTIPLVTALLLLFLCLLYFISALSFRFPFLSADLPAFRFHFFPLSLKNLLGFRADTCVLQLLSGISASSFGIVCRMSGFYFDDRTENQFIVMLQNVFPDLVIFRLCAEGHLTYRQLPILNTFKDTGPEWILEEYG